MLYAFCYLTNLFHHLYTGGLTLICTTLHCNCPSWLGKMNKTKKIYIWPANIFTTTMAFLLSPVKRKRVLHWNFEKCFRTHWLKVLKSSSARRKKAQMCKRTNTCTNTCTIRATSTQPEDGLLILSFLVRGNMVQQNYHFPSYCFYYALSCFV